MDRRLFVLAALALGGCATVPGARLVASGSMTLGELEPLYAVQKAREGLRIKVASNGCTAKADLAFYVERRGDIVALAFGRKQVDACKSSVKGHTELTFTWEELGLARRAPILLLNPIAP
jgi:hypothetical protein